MKIFLDTANIQQIQDGFNSSLIDGVTTNPSLAAKEGKDFDQIIKDILKIFRGTEGYISLEVVSEKADEMVKEGVNLAKLSKNVVVKVPCTKEGYKACKILSSRGIRVNMTLCFSASQALLAAKAGAFFISPFLDRLDDQNQDGIGLIREIRDVFDNYNYKTQILVASIRDARHVIEVAMIGADACTLPYNIFEKLYIHS